MEPARTIAERIVAAEQKRCNEQGCICVIREDDCGIAGDALVNAIAHAIEDVREEMRALL